MTLVFSIQQHTFHFLPITFNFLVLQLYKEIEICPKDTKVIEFDKAESCTVGFGMFVSDR